MASSYDQDFPPLSPQEDHSAHLFSRPYIQPSEILPKGHKPSTQAKQVLNWHTQNVRSQNRVLQQIDRKLTQVSSHISHFDHRLLSMSSQFRDMYTDLQSRIAKLDTDLHYYIQHGYNGPQFAEKEYEICHFKEQLSHMNNDLNRFSSYVPRSYPYFSCLIFPNTPPYASPSAASDKHNSFFKSTGELFCRHPIQSTRPSNPPIADPSSSKHHLSTVFMTTHKFLALLLKVIPPHPQTPYHPLLLMIHDPLIQLMIFLKLFLKSLWLLTLHLHNLLSPILLEILTWVPYPSLKNHLTSLLKILLPNPLWSSVFS